MNSKSQLDLSDIDYVKPLSKTSKNVDKYFKNCTLQELKAKMEEMKNFKFTYNADVQPDKDAKVPVEKKIQKFYVKVDLLKKEQDINKRMVNRNEKLKELKKKRILLNLEENDNIFPGKYSLNYSAISKKVKTVIIKDKSNFRKLKEEKSVDSSILNISNQESNKNNEKEKESIKETSGFDIEKFRKAIEDKNKPKPKKIVNSVESLKGINSIGTLKKGIKFASYSSRDYSVFGLPKERKSHNNSIVVVPEQSLIKNDNEKKNVNIEIEDDLIKLIKNNLPIVNPNYFQPNKNPLAELRELKELKSNEIKLEEYKKLKIKNKISKQSINFDKSKMKHNRRLSSHNERDSSLLHSQSKDNHSLNVSSIIINTKKKMKTNPQLNFKNMTGRDYKFKSDEVPDGLIYQPNFDYTRPKKHLVLPFHRNPEFFNKQFLIKKLWSSYNNDKDMKILEIEAYLKDQEESLANRNNPYKEGGLEFKNDF